MIDVEVLLKELQLKYAHLPGEFSKKMVQAHFTAIMERQRKKPVFESVVGGVPDLSVNYKSYLD